MLLLLMTADDEVVIITIGYDLVGYDDNGEHERPPSPRSVLLETWDMSSLLDTVHV